MVVHYEIATKYFPDHQLLLEQKTRGILAKERVSEEKARERAAQAVLEGIIAGHIVHMRATLHPIVNSDEYRRSRGFKRAMEFARQQLTAPQTLRQFAKMHRNAVLGLIAMKALVAHLETSGELKRGFEYGSHPYQLPRAPKP